jgi:hypothetical protein
VAPALRPAAPAVDAEPKVLVRPPVQNEADPPGPAVKRVEAAKSERDGTVVPAPAAAPAAPVDEPPPEAVTRQETATDRAAEVERRNVAAPAMSAGAAQGGIAATASASAARRDAVASVNAEDWAARVAALYDAGTVTEAADALRAFRAAYPDADEYLPEPLRDWARTIE